MTWSNQHALTVLPLASHYQELGGSCMIVLCSSIPDTQMCHTCISWSAGPVVLCLLALNVTMSLKMRVPDLCHVLQAARPSRGASSPCPSPAPWRPLCWRCS